MVVGDFALELDTVVIGSGPGGYVAAIRAAQLGKKVAIVERGSIGGVCLNVGCIPSKALINVGHRYQDSLNSSTFGVEAKDVTLDFEKAQKWKDDEVVSKLTGGVEMLLKKNKVEIIKGEAFFNDKNQFRVIDAESAQSYTFNDAIIATGSRPIEIKGFKFGGRVLDSSGVLALKEVPKHLVVIGGGYIGSELANAYANLGSKITILEAQPDILMGFDKDMVALAKKDFVEKGMTIIPNAFAQQAKETENGIAVTYKVDDKEETIDADYVLVSVGRRPNTDNLGLHLANVDVDERGIVKVDKQGRTSNPNIYAIGDITPGAALAHKASYEAKVAAAAIAGQNSEIDYVAMPAVCFTDVELATVGLTQQQAKDQGISVKVSKFPFEANGRALSLAATNGFVRILTDKETGTVLGGQVAGVNAGEMVGELTLAIEGRMNIEDISLTIHAHPTISETIMDAAELAQGLPIHI